MLRNVISMRRVRSSVCPSVSLSARQMSVWSRLCAAQVFKMPAMSPTMTEGGIVAWKYKPGDEFAAGDVLLEVETDKATIDVEAQDDGVMWEILAKDGESGIPVGKPIAFLAEPGDDLNSLEKPKIEDTPKEAPKEKEPKKQEKEESKVELKKESNKQEKNESKTQKTDSDCFTKADPAQKLTPAVEVLMHRHHISAEEAFEKIPASGPKGRLLLGDILAYVGEIDVSAVSKIAQYVKSKEHLDLSNIKVAPVAKKEAPKKPAEKPKPTNVLSIEFSSELGSDISKEKFQFAFERALDAAKRQTYGVRFPNYARSPVSSGLYEDDIFDDLLVAPVSKERFAVSDIAYRFLGESSSRPFSGDAFDELLGLAPKPVVVAEASGRVTAVVSFKVTFDEKLTDSKKFVEYFQDALLSQIPAKQLIIHQ